MAIYLFSVKTFVFFLFFFFRCSSFDKKEGVGLLSLMLRPTVSRPVCLGIMHPPGAYDQIFFFPFGIRNTSDSYVLHSVGRPLWREDGSVFCMCRWPLPAQSFSVVVPWDRILLSQIWDFPFRRLLRLAGSRWRYSTPPPHGWVGLLHLILRYTGSARTTQKTPSSFVKNACLQFRCLATDVLLFSAFAWRGPHRKRSFPYIVVTFWRGCLPAVA
jgi:hypothetical protein